MLDIYDDLEGSTQMRSIRDFESLIATMKDAQNRLDEISETLSNLHLAISSAAARSLNERERATESLLSYLKDTIAGAAKMKGNDSVSRAFRTAGKTMKMADGIVKIRLEGIDAPEVMHPVSTCGPNLVK